MHDPILGYRRWRPWHNVPGRAWYVARRALRMLDARVEKALKLRKQKETQRGSHNKHRK